MNMSSKIKNLFYLSLIYKNFSLLVIRIYILSNIEILEEIVINISKYNNKYKKNI